MENNANSQSLNKAVELAIKCYEADKLQDAHDLLVKVLSIDPKHQKASYFLGVIYLRIENYDRALQFFKISSTVSSKNPYELNNLGLALKGLGNLKEAREVYSKAIKIDPSLGVVYSNLAEVLSLLSEDVLAEKNYEKAISKGFNSVKCLNNLAWLYRKHTEPRKAYQLFKAAFEKSGNRLDIYSNALLSLVTIPTVSSEEYLSEALAFGDKAREGVKPYKQWSADENKLKVGFVSGDLRKHSVYFFINSFLKYLKRPDLEIVAYYNFPSKDDYTLNIKSIFDNCVDVYEMPDKELSEKIHSDGINILFDLSGHTAFNRLPVFCYKPAPVQISWIGYFASTGLSEMDYFFGDHWNLPKAIQNQYVEKIFHLPVSGCFTAPSTEAVLTEPPCMKNGYITFGCFHSPSKLNDDVISTWSTILKKVPTSKLLLKGFGSTESAHTQKITELFVSNGVDSDRLIYEGYSTGDSYFEAFSRIDLGLDPYPNNGSTVNFQSLWMGVPYVALLGSTRISRRGAGLLCKVDLESFVAKTEQEYVSKSVELAGSHETLLELRKSLRNMIEGSKLFDGKSMGEDVKKALYRIWADYRDQSNNS